MIKIKEEYEETTCIEIDNIRCIPMTEANLMGR